MNSLGRLVWYLEPGGGTAHTLATPASVLDGRWHQAVATLSSGTGAKIYLDGVLVAADPTLTSGRSYASSEANVKIGCGATGSLPNGSGGNGGMPVYFTGAIQFVSAYGRELSATEVKQHYIAGT